MTYHRIIAIVLGILGLGILGVLIVMGRDPQRESHIGPKWKRRLVAAALALLGLSGVWFFVAPEPPEPEMPKQIISCYMRKFKPASLPSKKQIHQQLKDLRSNIRTGKITKNTAKKSGYFPSGKGVCTSAGAYWRISLFE